MLYGNEHNCTPIFPHYCYVNMSLSQVSPSLPLLASKYRSYSRTYVHCTTVLCKSWLKIKISFRPLSLVCWTPVLQPRQTRMTRVVARSLLIQVYSPYLRLSFAISFAGQLDVHLKTVKRRLSIESVGVNILVILFLCELPIAGLHYALCCLYIQRVERISCPSVHSMLSQITAALTLCCLSSACT